MTGHATDSKHTFSVHVYVKYERRAFAQTIIVPFNNWLEPDVGDGRVRVRARRIIWAASTIVSAFSLSFCCCTL